MNYKSKIIFYLPNLHGGGAERVAVNMIRQLNKQKFDVSLALVDNTGVYKSLIPDHVTIYDLKAKKTILSLFKLRKLIQKSQPDIVFSTLFRAHNVLYLALLGINKKPIIILRSPNSPKLVLEHNQLSRLTKFLLEKAYRNADMILAQTPEMKDEIIKYHHITGSKIKVFLNPLDTNLIDEKIQNVVTPFDNDMINVVAAGRLTKQKGFDILIQAFRYVVDKNNDFILHIIGSDSGEKENLEKMVRDLNLEKNVKFLGFQENPYRFFLLSDLYVLSSRWEGLPNTVLENLYLEKPVVATKCIPFMSQLINDGENGFLVDVGNISQLAEAILKFKSIDSEKNVPLVCNSDVDKLFLDVNKLS